MNFLDFLFLFIRHYHLSHPARSPNYVQCPDRPNWSYLLLVGQHSSMNMGSSKNVVCELVLTSSVVPRWFYSDSLVKWPYSCCLAGCCFLDSFKQHAAFLCISYVAFSPGILFTFMRCSHIVVLTQTQHGKNLLLLVFTYCNNNNNNNNNYYYYYYYHYRKWCNLLVKKIFWKKRIKICAKISN